MENNKITREQAINILLNTEALTADININIGIIDNHLGLLANNQGLAFPEDYLDYLVENYEDSVEILKENFLDSLKHNIFATYE